MYSSIFKKMIAKRDSRHVANQANIVVYKFTGLFQAFQQNLIFSNRACKFLLYRFKTLVESEVFTHNNIAGYANVARLSGAKHVLSVYCICLSYLKYVDHNLTGNFCQAVLFCLFVDFFTKINFK